MTSTDENAIGIEVSVACLTDTGRVRSVNEDAFVIAEVNDKQVETIAGNLHGYRVGSTGLLLAVSDGMGGAQAGEVASRLAIEQLMRRLGAPARQESIAERLSDGLKSANHTIRHASARIPHSRAWARP